MAGQRRAAGPKVEPRTRLRSTSPTLREERRLLRTGHPLLAGVDEVGAVPSPVP